LFKYITKTKASKEESIAKQKSVQKDSVSPPF